MSMRILFLDDNHLRRRDFVRSHIGDIVALAETAEEAIRLLGNGTSYDLVSLDHDLTEAHYGDIYAQEEHADSGLAVARFIAQMETPPPKIILHTWNNMGALKMFHAMEHLGIEIVLQPFDTDSAITIPWLPRPGSSSGAP